MESTAVVKAFALLEAAAAVPQGSSLGELAARVGLNKPTAHRVLKTLAALGYMEKTGFGQYRQTPRVRRLIIGANESRLMAAAEPHLQTLHRDTKETVNLGILQSSRILYLRVLESTQPLRRVVTPNSIDPFFCTALGRAIVAFLPPAQADLLLNSGRWEARTPYTVVDPRELADVLTIVAEQGFAVEKDQTDVGVTCISAPILEDGAPVAAVSLSVPSARASEAVEKSLVDAVRTTAKSIESSLAAFEESRS